jgi:hypothetical protein
MPRTSSEDGGVPMDPRRVRAVDRGFTSASEAIEAETTKMARKLKADEKGLWLVDQRSGTQVQTWLHGERYLETKRWNPTLGDRAWLVTIEDLETGRVVSATAPDRRHNVALEWVKEQIVLEPEG